MRKLVQQIRDNVLETPSTAIALIRQARPEIERPGFLEPTGLAGVARPIPEVPPVIRATFPFSLMFSHSYLYSLDIGPGGHSTAARARQATHGTTGCKDPLWFLRRP